jgi:hypothetical protein
MGLPLTVVKAGGYRRGENRCEFNGSFSRFGCFLAFSSRAKLLRIFAIGLNVATAAATPVTGSLSQTASPTKANGGARAAVAPMLFGTWALIALQRG